MPVLVLTSDEITAVVVQAGERQRESELRRVACRAPSYTVALVNSCRNPPVRSALHVAHFRPHLWVGSCEGVDRPFWCEVRREMHLLADNLAEIADVVSWSHSYVTPSWVVGMVKRTAKVNGGQSGLFERDCRGVGKALRPQIGWDGQLGEPFAGRTILNEERGLVITSPPPIF
jgi:hypothetical protein